MHIVAGAVIRKAGKYLLVQEAAPKCYGLWNVPAGHSDIGETIFEATEREVKEETNCDVELTGICQIGNYLWADDLAITVIFTANLLTDDVRYPADELLDAKWFTYDEIQDMKNQLRTPKLILGAIEAVEKGKIAPLDLIVVTRDENSRK